MIIVGFALLDGFSANTADGLSSRRGLRLRFLNVQLPAAASLERTDQVLKKVEGILDKTEGVQYLHHHRRLQSAESHFSQLPGFLLHEFRALGRAHIKRAAGAGNLTSINGALASQVPEAIAFAFMPPSIPGLGSAGGFSFWLQDRSGGSVEFLDQNLQKFLAAARKRPEMAGVDSQFSASVPQIFADVDRDKVLKQGVAVADVYQTLQAYLGGLYLNQFNRFGRQWRVFLQAEGEERRSEQDIRQLLRAEQSTARWFRSRLW